MFAGGIKSCQTVLRWMFIVCLLGFLVPAATHGAPPSDRGPQRPDFWTPSVAPSVTPSGRDGERTTVHRARFELRRSNLEAALAGAPRERKGRGLDAGIEINLPLPDGRSSTFVVTESPVMEEGLARKFPHLRTFAGHSVENPGERVRLNLTQRGLHAFIVGGGRQVLIDPTDGDDAEHVSYFKDEAARDADGFECLTQDCCEEVGVAAATAGTVSASGELRIARLALAATGEYTQFHGGTVEGALAAMVTALNRVNAIYESELSLRFLLVANNDRIIFTNPATDPYTGNDATAMLAQNQSTLDALIGNANYDVGHVFSTAGGGLAHVGGAGVPGYKARGVTGRPSPVGDPFYVDYVTHELAHQFGAYHTFNGVHGACSASHRHAGSAYEPGSGSTIMGYAGICGADNLQSGSDAYFHAVSLAQIQAFLATRALLTESFANQPPVVDAGPDRVIPRGTPFILTATGWDGDGDILTYAWEQVNLGLAAALTAGDTGSGPLFRSRPPSVEPSRSFPPLAAILSGQHAPGETLPSTGRTLNFRVTARDGRAFAMDQMQVTVAGSAGPFRVTHPLGGETHSISCTVRWDVAGTSLSPVFASHVDILLSTNGGFDYPIMLAAATPNDGMETVSLPDVFSENARIKVRATDNVFFNVSPGNFVVHPHAGPPQFVLNTLAWTNPASLLIPATGTMGNASVYPASIVVAEQGVIEDVAVVLHGLSHTYAPDLDILLVPPTGQPIMLLSDVGSDGDLLNANLKFSDAGEPIPLWGLPGSGHWQPKNIGATGDDFPVPGPYAVTFAGLQGLPAAGTWSLYVRDDASGDTGSLAAGWSLLLTLRQPLPAKPAPVINAPALTYVHEGARLRVQPEAYDPDGGNGSLSFSLVAPHPDDVSLDPATGLVSWRPPAGMAGSTHEWTIAVTDSGTPAQTSTATMTVVVVPPVSASLQLSEQGLALAWSAAPGNRYEIQTASDLASGAWQAWESGIEAADFWCARAGLPADGARRFFRVRVLE